MTHLSIIYAMVVLKELRAENNLTQEKLAQAIGTNQRTVARWEVGKSDPSVFYILKLAEYFHVSADYLLGVEDDLGHKSYIDVQDDITPEEQKLITAYRKLSPSNREMILRMLNIA